MPKYGADSVETKEANERKTTTGAVLNVIVSFVWHQKIEQNNCHQSCSVASRSDDSTEIDHHRK